MSEWRKVKTGTDDQGEDTFEYQFGGEIDGVFVPAVTKNAGYIEHLHETLKAAAQSEQDEAEQSGTPPDES